jgi:hypothetical protein
MLTRTLAVAAAVVGLAAGAQAGTLQNGAWTPNCPNVPGEPPEFSTKSPEAFNKSQKLVQEWQSQVIAYNDCIKGEVKADQDTIVGTANNNIKKLSDELSGLGAAQQAAIEKLKKQSH